MPDYPVVVRGGGDLASGVVLRLWRAGFPVVILEQERPLAVRRTVAFSQAVYNGAARVEEAKALLCRPGELAVPPAPNGEIPVIVDPEARLLAAWRPFALVDAIMAKRNTGTRRGMASLVVGLGPGFVAGEDVDAVVETNRGPSLGRVIWSGAAEPNTGTPGSVDGYRAERVLRAPVSGTLRTPCEIGDRVAAGQTVATVDGIAISAPFPGLVRGLLRDGTPVHIGLKVGDIDPRGDPDLVHRVSDKALAVAGGVLEAILMAIHWEEP